MHLHSACPLETHAFSIVPHDAVLWTQLERIPAKLRQVGARQEGECLVHLDVLIVSISHGVCSA